MKDTDRIMVVSVAGSAGTLALPQNCRYLRLPAEYVTTVDEAKPTVRK